MLKNFFNWAKLSALANLLLEWEGEELRLSDESRQLLAALGNIGSTEALGLAKVMQNENA